MTLKEEIIDAAPTRCERTCEIMETVKGVIAECVLDMNAYYVASQSLPLVAESLARLGYYDAKVSVRYNVLYCAIDFSVDADGVTVSGRINL